MVGEYGGECCFFLITSKILYLIYMHLQMFIAMQGISVLQWNIGVKYFKCYYHGTHWLNYCMLKEDRVSSSSLVPTNITIQSNRNYSIIRCNTHHCICYQIHSSILYFSLPISLFIYYFISAVIWRVSLCQGKMYDPW